MKIEYLPNIGFSISNQILHWYDERAVVRQKLQNRHQEDNNTIAFDDEPGIEQRRDVYTNFDSDDNYFFLNYDERNRLKECEIHWGIDIELDGLVLEFGKEISEMVKELNKRDFAGTEIEKGNFLFNTLKIAIADDEAMGGDGTALSYFYASSDISHLIEE